MKKLLVISAYKDTEEYVFETGCIPHSGSSIDLQAKGSTYASLAELAKEWGFSEKPNEGWTIIDDRLIYARIENEEGDEPSEYELLRWKTGKQKMWLADYNFHVVIIDETAPTEAQLIEFTGVKA